MVKKLPAKPKRADLSKVKGPLRSTQAFDAALDFAKNPKDGLHDELRVNASDYGSYHEGYVFVFDDESAAYLDYNMFLISDSVENLSGYFGY